MARCIINKLPVRLAHFVTNHATHDRAARSAENASARTASATPTGSQFSPGDTEDEAVEPARIMR